PAAAAPHREAAPPPPSREDDPNPLEATIYRFILRHSLPQQLLLLVLTVVSFPFLYVSLDLPKTIINHAIQGGSAPRKLLGIEFSQIGYLFVLCAAFLVLVFINGGFKYVINTCKGQLGERMLRRLRFQLYHRMLRFPLSQFHKTSSAQIIPMITSEGEALGGFIGDAFALPAFQGGTLLTIVLFMFMQDPVLGAAAVALYPFQLYAIPKLQRRVNQLGRLRVREIRRVADRIQESASGIVDVRANDMVKLQLAGFADLLGHIYDIRFEIYQRKYFIKFLNNFIAQLTPFFFYSLGGYLVIRGQLSFGGLVAVLAAYKDLAPPWRELLNFYQIKEDARIKYEQIVEQFDVADMVDAHLQLAEPETPARLTGDVAAVNLSLSEDDKSRVVDGVSFSFSLAEHVAVIGQAGSGKGELAMLLARLIAPTGGRITIGGADLAALPDAVVGRRIGYVGPSPHLFAGTLYENLFYALSHRPMRPGPPEAAAGRRARRQNEARKSGNIELDIRADWIDYEAAGVEDGEALSRRIIEILEQLDLAEDVYRLGLRGLLDPAQKPAAAERLLAARGELARRLAAEGLGDLVETYDPERFNSNASVAENLLFGTPLGPAFEVAALAENTYVLRVLDKLGLTQDLVEAGREVAETMVELFSDLSPEHEFFEQFSFIGAGDLPVFAEILARIGRGGTRDLARADRAKLLSLPFKLIPARHRLDVLDTAMQTRLLEARRAIRTELPAEARQQIEFFDAGRYNRAATVQDNILFGKIAYGVADAVTRVPQILAEIIDALALRQTILETGLDHDLGPSGSRLSPAQRQKAAIARAVLKRPDLLILNEATSALDGQAQAAVMKGLQQELAGRSILWVLQRPSLARNFDRVLVMSQGRLEEQGRFAELDTKGSLMSLLIAAE
ncbi:MAG TPA: ATP-binding cassette domain-containing protein, partial [Stellaceae bacterium]|nr:ATP-binding cassette domain-containing protein [Stellaceae bacterium]